MLIVKLIKGQRAAVTTWLKISNPFDFITIIPVQTLYNVFNFANSIRYAVPHIGLLLLIRS